MPKGDSNLQTKPRWLSSQGPYSPEKQKLNLNLYGETLKIYPQVKFLGITFDSQLNFQKLFEDILDCCNTRHHRLILLVNKKWGPRGATLIQIYKQCVRPIFEYSSLSIIAALNYIISKFSGSRTNLYGLPFVYQNTFALSCCMTPLAFHLWRIDSSPVQPSP